MKKMICIFILIFSLILAMGAGVIFSYSFVHAQTWVALPPYNLLWPLWSPVFSPFDPITGVPAPLIDELTSDTVLPVQPCLVWDPGQDYPYLLCNSPFGMIYYNPLLNGFNSWPPTDLLNPITGLPISIGLPDGWSMLPPTSEAWLSIYFPIIEECCVDDLGDLDNDCILPFYLATRTSPFDPPINDAFVADNGPGLDIGCTFNVDPNHPLIIDILIDRFVGEVDENGFLVDPGLLIDEGIIPSSVVIIMSVYDVDYNGNPSPEQDEVLFNGESLGFLVGDNNLWNLNSFTLDIRNVKFPSESYPGVDPIPVANQLQINVDLLNIGRWCTAIDWVALIIPPIRPELALTLEPRSDNKIRVNDLTSNDTIDIIYKQSFDADCEVVDDIVSFDENPFSGPVSGIATLNTKLETCPAESIQPPDVFVVWEIEGTSQRGVTIWTGFEGNITIMMPEKIGVYTVRLIYIINNYKIITLTRKLFVTKNSPVEQVDPPRLTWYERAIDWASGEEDDYEILEKLLSGLYAFGGANWRYGYDFGSDYKCDWKDLVADDPITCNYSDCYVFSDVFENMAATLGIGGLSPSVSTGTHNAGFLTTRDVLSLDPNFPGNAKYENAVYDSYFFRNHSLRLFSSRYYDATFNGVYSSEDDFIAYNRISVEFEEDKYFGSYWPTDDEHVRIYPGQDSPFYDSWSNFIYARIESIYQIQDSLKMPINAQNIRFTGNVTFSMIDENLDDILEGLMAQVEVELLSPGVSTIFGTLKKNGHVIANSPEFESMLFTKATLNEPPGIYTVSLKFSGEQISQSGKNGPYDLDLYSIGEDSFDTLTAVTPFYNHEQFGEIKAALKGATDFAIDENGDGKWDFIEVVINVDVRLAGDYRLQGFLIKDGTSIVNTGGVFTFTQGKNDIKLRFSGLRIHRSGLDGPYEGVVNIIDAEGHTFGGIEFETQPYNSFNFGTLLELDGSFNDQGIDTNGNGLFDILRIEFGANVTESGTFLINGVLKNQTSPLVVFTEISMALLTGPQILTLNFSGPLIYDQEMDGPYEVKVILLDSDTFNELDYVMLPQMTGIYSFTDFDPLDVFDDIVLTGKSLDEGIDINSNGLFDELHIEVEAELTTTDFYEWSARLVDVNGTEIGFDSRAAHLNAGTTTINFIFDGELIGQNLVDGPYYVKRLLMFGLTGPNLFSIDVVKTQAYRASEFEGYVIPNNPPVAQCQDVSVWADEMCLGFANIDIGSYDPDGDPITIVQSPSGPYDLGDTLVTLTATDDKGAFGTCQAIVAVIDATAPEIACPPDITAEQTSADGTPVNLGNPTVSDICDVDPEVINNAPAVFPLGETIVTWTATDVSGNFLSCSQIVTVVDTIPPVIHSISASPNSLWPPNHKMVPVSVTCVCEDTCDIAPVCRIISVESNQPVNDNGDGNTDPDWEITGDLSVDLRAERSGNIKGDRIYTITVQCTDFSGNSNTDTVEVIIKHDQGKNTAQSINGRANKQAKSISSGWMLNNGSGFMLNPFTQGYRIFPAFNQLKHLLFTPNYDMIYGYPFGMHWGWNMNYNPYRSPILGFPFYFSNAVPPYRSFNAFYYYR